MTGPALRRAALYCLAVWLLVWVLFLLLRFSVIDLRHVPGSGFVMLGALALALLAAVAAAALSGAAALRQPAVAGHWLVLGGSVAALLGEMALFVLAKWL